jgi:hypothetical protein
LSGTTPEPFVLDGEDWFAITESSPLTWAQIRQTVETEQQRLAAIVADLHDAKHFDLALGITCHAIYHAGQIQLIKRLHSA